MSEELVFALVKCIGSVRLNFDAIVVVVLVVVEVVVVAVVVIGTLGVVMAVVSVVVCVVDVVVVVVVVDVDVGGLPVVNLSMKSLTASFTFGKKVKKENGEEEEEESFPGLDTLIEIGFCDVIVGILTVVVLAALSS